MSPGSDLNASAPRNVPPSNPSFTTFSNNKRSAPTSSNGLDGNLTTKRQKLAGTEKAVTASTTIVKYESFTSFPKLPPELRCIIWSYGLRAPQVMDMTWTTTLSQHRTTCVVRHSQRLFQVNYESRDMAKRYYKTKFSDPAAPPRNQLALLNTSLDVLCIAPSDQKSKVMVAAYLSSHMAEVQHVALKDKWSDEDYLFENMYTRLRHLRTVCLVVDAAVLYPSNHEEEKTSTQQWLDIGRRITLLENVWKHMGETDTGKQRTIPRITISTLDVSPGDGCIVYYEYNKDEGDGRGRFIRI